LNKYTKTQRGKTGNASVLVQERFAWGFILLFLVEKKVFFLYLGFSLTSFIGPGLMNWCEHGPVYIGL
jgi:hypothetical protein